MVDRLKIAIADDEAMVCVVIQNAIDFDGIGLDLVGVAYDGSSLFNIITAENPDIVITDISMPGMNGLDLVKKVRQRKIECKFIIISGYSQFDYAHKAIKDAFCQGSNRRKFISHQLHVSSRASRYWKLEIISMLKIRY